jgi:hypothetical protein
MISMRSQTGMHVRSKTVVIKVSVCPVMLNPLVKITDDERRSDMTGKGKLINVLGFSAPLEIKVFFGSVFVVRRM